MSEVQAALDQAMLETGVATVTPEMAMRDAYRAFARKTATMLGGDPDDLVESPIRIEVNRVPSARGYRVRLYLDSVHGPIWLEWLGALAETLGVADVDHGWGATERWLPCGKGERVAESKRATVIADIEDSLWE